MADLGDLVQKAFYMGVGIASYAGEKATVKLAELRTQGQKLADEMVSRGEMTAEEASKFVDDLIKQAQQKPVPEAQNKPQSSTGPRMIEIIAEEDEKTTQGTGEVNNLRQQVESLQEELRRLQHE